MTDWLIFSKDRPMQLHALLESAQRWRIPCKSASVLYTYTFDDAEAGYREVKRQFPGILYKQDGVFSEDVTAFLLFVPGPVAFLTDDCLWIGPAPDAHPLPFSYRLGLNTSKAWHGDQQPPESTTWDWHGKPGDYGYPLSLDGVVYQQDTLMPLLDFPFRNPTELEAGLAARSDRFRPQSMSMAKRNSLITFAHNRVSESSGCAISNLPGHDVHTLAARYLNGERIRPDQMNLQNVDYASTLEVPYAIG